MINEAIILAGGFGTRLKSVISEIPKPMAPINDQPFLNYQLRYLRKQGIKKVILSIGHLREKITDYYKSNFEGIEIDYSIEKEPLGTGGGIRLALQKCESDSVFVLNGDSFFEIDLNDLYNKHKKNQADCSLALRKVSNAGRYGTIKKDVNQRINAFEEKTGINGPGIINAGIYLVNRNLYLDNTDAGTNFSIEKDFFEKRVQQLAIYGFEFDGYFIDIGIPEDYNKAQDDFKGSEYR